MAIMEADHAKGIKETDLRPIKELLGKLRALPKVEDKADVLDLITDLLLDFPRALKNEPKRISDTLSLICDIAEGKEEDVEVCDVDDENGEPQRPERLTKWTQWIGFQIKEQREKREWTQAQLAERSGLPQSHISRLESGKHSPSRKTMTKLANAFGMDVEVLADDSYWRA